MERARRDLVVLVDERDGRAGTAEKLAAHRRGLLHRAVSAFLFDARGRLLLQQRAASKYHSGGLWANSCCSHPRPGESPAACMARRLPEELGVAPPVREFGCLLYRTPVGAGLTEHEYVHGFAGRVRGEPYPRPREVARTRWVSLRELHACAARSPRLLAPWLRIYVARGFVDRAAAALR